MLDELLHRTRGFFRNDRPSNTVCQGEFSDGVMLELPVRKFVGS